MSGAGGAAAGARREVGGSRIVDAGALAWREFDEARGARYKVLNKTEGGSLTLLLQFAPGSEYPAHTHPAG